MSDEEYRETSTTLTVARTSMYSADSGSRNHSWHITDTDLRMFVEFMQRYNAQHNWSQSHPTLRVDASYPNSSRPATGEDCSDYCKGDFYQLLKTYNSSIHGYVSLMICMFGTIANILNVVVLTKKDMAKAPINRILKWLAVADMFIMLEYIPFAFYQYICKRLDEQDFRYVWAVYILLHMHFTQILHTISISLTVTLAFWRYIAIRQPHGAFAGYMHSHCNESILLSFALAPLLCCPTFFVFKVQKRIVADSVVPLYHVDADKNTQLYRINFWVHSVIIKLLPCCILTVISLTLIQVLCEAAQRKQKLKSYGSAAAATAATAHQRTSSVPRCDRRTDRTTLLLVAVLTLFLITEFPQGILGLLSGIMEKCFFNACYPPFGEAMDLLALINASTDFVLYGLMSRQFRSTFVSLFSLRRHYRPSEPTTRTTRLGATCV